MSIRKGDKLGQGKAVIDSPPSFSGAGEKGGSCHKMSMLNHNTLSDLWVSLKWPSTITRLTAHFTCGLMPDVVICNIGKSMVLFMTLAACPYWTQAALNSINSSQLSSITFTICILGIGTHSHLDSSVLHPTSYIWAYLGSPKLTERRSKRKIENLVRQDAVLVWWCICYQQCNILFYLVPTTV